jgi:hypothetical protein
MNTCQRITPWIVTVLCVAVFLFAGAALAQDEPDTLPATGAALNTANSYVTHLDELRVQAQAAEATRMAAAGAGRGRYGAYEFSSDLQRLNDLAAQRMSVPDANDYITTLDHLRTMGSYADE